MRSVCGIALDKIQNASNSPYGNLGAIPLCYGSIYGNQEHQLAVSSAVSETVEIVALGKGLKAAVNFEFTAEVQLKWQIAKRAPDLLQVYVKVEKKLLDNGWQTILNFLNLGKEDYKFRVMSLHCKSQS